MIYVMVSSFWGDRVTNNENKGVNSNNPKDQLGPSNGMGVQGSGYLG